MSPKGSRGARWTGGPSLLGEACAFGFDETMPYCGAAFDGFRLPFDFDPVRTPMPWTSAPGGGHRLVVALNLADALRDLPEAAGPHETLVLEPAT